MKKIMLLLLAVMLVSCTGPAYGSGVCAECDAYKYQAVVPYATGDAEWWTGFAVTNTSWDDALLRLDFVGADGKVVRMDIGPKGVTVFPVELEGANYVVLRSDLPLTVTVVISNGVACIDSVVFLTAIPEE